MIVIPSGRRSSDPVPVPERQRHAAQQRRHRSHHDRPEAQQACLINRVVRILALFALGFEREIDHHDGVLLHDADQQHDADNRHHASIPMRHTISASSAPTPAEGSVDRIVIGWM